MTPIFVKIRNDKGELYPSYTDFWKLVELSGFPTCELDDVNPDSKDTYIFSPDNGNVRACCDRPHQATFILWQLERPGKVENKVPHYFDSMLVSDRYFHKLVNDKFCQFVEIGGHEGLGIYSYNLPKTWDFAHMSYAYGRRQDMYEKLRSQGFTLAPNGWGEDRHDILTRSRGMLCFHQDDMPVIEPLRYVLAACYGLPILAENSVDFSPYKVNIFGYDKQYEDQEQAESNYKLMTTDLTFEKCLLGVING